MCACIQGYLDQYPNEYEDPAKLAGYLDQYPNEYDDPSKLAVRRISITGLCFLPCLCTFSWCMDDNFFFCVRACSASVMQFDWYSLALSWHCVPCSC